MNTTRPEPTLARRTRDEDCPPKGPSLQLAILLLSKDRANFERCGSVKLDIVSTDQSEA